MQRGKSYNYAAFLPFAIESCLAQTHEAVEIVVVDDGSTDNTRQVLEAFRDRIVYVRQENLGVSAARNKGLDIASGEFIAFLDADDYLTADAVEVRLREFRKNPEVGVVFTETFSKKASGPVRSNRQRLPKVLGICPPRASGQNACRAYIPTGRTLLPAFLLWLQCQLFFTTGEGTGATA